METQAENQGIVTETMPKETIKVIDSLPKQKREVILQAISAFQGPLPPPEILAGYEEISPGFADRIMAMAEKQQEHRIRLETSMVRRQLNQKSFGQLIGFVITIVILSAVVYLAIEGHDWLAGILGTTTLLGIGHIFVLGVRASNNKPVKKNSSSPKK